jgi:hypothetical protein
MHAVEKRDTQLVVGKLNFAEWKKQLAACSEKLCLIHAVKRRDTHLVVEKLFLRWKIMRVVEKTASNL